MNMTMRSIRFWGRLCLEYIGICAGGAIVWLLFMGAGSGDFFGTGNEGILSLAELYPHYLLLIGAVVVLIMGINNFQVYFPIVLSMNATRKSIAWGIVGCMAGTVLGIVFISAIIWGLVPGDVSSSGWKLMPLFTGVLFIIAAFSLLFGVAAIRWGKVGVIVVMIMCALAGAGIGMAVALSDKGILEFLDSIADGDFKLLAAAGIVLYLAAGIFVAKAIRNLEVRA